MFSNQFYLINKKEINNSTKSKLTSFILLKQRMGGLCAPTHCINSGFQSVALDGSCSVKHNVEVCVRGETSENVVGK